MDSDQLNKDVMHSSTVRTGEIFRVYCHRISATRNRTLHRVSHCAQTSANYVVLPYKDSISLNCIQQ